MAVSSYDLSFPVCGGESEKRRWKGGECEGERKERRIGLDRASFDKSEKDKADVTGVFS